ncbi:MAG: RluA family pseudouridine synthase [Desulfuromonas sp.]|nr:RluA family pseudouridine synthase [Desulfuromonas sp.]
MEQRLFSPGVYRFVVPGDQSGVRLDLFLAGALEGGRGMIKRMIDLGGAHVDGRRVRRCSLSVVAGQHIELHVDGLPLEPFRLDTARIIYRDRYLLALDKPAGVATQPTPARYQGTIYAALQQFLSESGQVSLGMVQRLDRDTSGVLVFSTHSRAHKGLTAAFSEHRVTKRYLALVAGCLEHDAGEMQSQLARRRATNRMVSVERGGKPALTRYRRLACYDGASLVEVEIPTGRSHQIRIHFAEAGHPLLGDQAYGGPVMVGGVTIARQMLHASELCLDHPVSGARLELKSPLPEDFQKVLHSLATSQ